MQLPCPYCGRMMLNFAPMTLFCAFCEYKLTFTFTPSSSTALTIQANDRTWGEITREAVPQAFHDAFESEELAP